MLFQQKTSYLAGGHMWYAPLIALGFANMIVRNFHMSVSPICLLWAWGEVVVAVR